MDLYKQRQRWKIGLVVLALLFAGTSLWITNMLVNKLAGEERKKSGRAGSAQLRASTAHLCQRLCMLHKGAAAQLQL